MNAFKDFGIKTTVKSFVGDKIKMSKILNKEITVLAFKIGPSKFIEKGNGKCLHLQIQIGDTKYVVFTGSTGLMEDIQKVLTDKFPFTTTIVEESERYEFT
jgi:hypothetical protein